MLSSILLVLGQPVTERTALGDGVVGVDGPQRPHGAGQREALAQAEEAGSAQASPRGAVAPAGPSDAAIATLPPGASTGIDSRLWSVTELAGADLLEQLPVRGAAAQEHVLPVVGDEAVARERVRGAAEPATRLEQRHLAVGPRAVERRGDARQAATDVTHDPLSSPRPGQAPRSKPGLLPRRQRDPSLQDLVWLDCDSLEDPLGRCPSSRARTMHCARRARSIRPSPWSNHSRARAASKRIELGVHVCQEQSSRSAACPRAADTRDPARSPRARRAGCS